MRRLALLFIAALSLWAAPALATANIANAPEYQTSHSYSVGDRFLSGPGWVAGAPGSYTNGSAVYLWAVTVAGTSSGSGNGPQTCGSPAGTGGIPTGSWGGATTATDGTVTATCLTAVDYVTLTDALGDSATNWAQSTTYRVGAFVIANGNIYVQRTVTTFDTACTSAGSGGGPSGTGAGTAPFIVPFSQISDGTCKWDWQGSLTYSSQASRWAHQHALWDVNTDPHYHQYEIEFTADVVLQIWYGGAQRTRYQPGQNNESDPILFANHTDLIGDIIPFCLGSTTVGNFPNSASETSCNGAGTPYLWKVTVAAGDSFVDNIAPGVGPLRYDESKGVSFFSNSPFNSSPHFITGTPIAFSDSGGTVERAQFQSTQAQCIDGHLHNTGPGSQHVDSIVVQQSLFDCGGGDGALGTDGGWVFRNAVVIVRGMAAGGFGIWMQYVGPIYNVTLINGSAAANSTCIQVNHSISIYQTAPPPFKNINCFGFANSYASGDNPTVVAANNATDVSSSPSVTPFTNSLSQTLTPAALAGVGSSCGPPGNASSCNSLVAANQFQNATIGASLDLRLKSTADVYGAGGNFSFATSPYWQTVQSPGGAMAPGSDILGTTRPQSSRYDIGAVEFIPTAAAVSQPSLGFVR